MSQKHSVFYFANNHFNETYVDKYSIGKDVSSLWVTDDKFTVHQNKKPRGENVRKESFYRSRPYSEDAGAWVIRLSSIPNGWV